MCASAGASDHITRNQKSHLALSEIEIFDLEAECRVKRGVIGLVEDSTENEFKGSGLA